MPVCVSVCVRAGQGLQSQSAAHADDVLLSYVSPAACQDQSSTHTPATNTYTHSLSEPDSTAPGPAAPAAEQEDTSKVPGGAAARCDSGPNIALLCGHGRHGGSAEK